MAKNTFTAATKLANGNIRVPARLSFPHLFDPKVYDDGKKSYEAAFIVDKSVDLTVLEEAVEEAIAEKFPTGKPKKNFKDPIHDGEDNDNYDGYSDKVVYFNARNKKRPYVVDTNRQDIDDEEEVYPGCYVLAVVRPFAFDNQSKGVSMSLQGVVKLKDGERLGGGVSDPDDDLADLDDEDFGDLPF